MMFALRLFLAAVFFCYWKKKEKKKMPEDELTWLIYHQDGGKFNT